MADPPSDEGAVQLTTDRAFAFEVAVTEVGAPGVVAGVTAIIEVYGVPDPTAFTAVTRKM